MSDGRPEHKKDEMSDELPELEDIFNEEITPKKNKRFKYPECIHGLDQCKECGKGYCPCGILKRNCRNCSPHNFCEHDRRKRRCKDCGKGYCSHKKQKSDCIECSPHNFCEHDRRKANCKDCGTGLCEHDCRKSNCIKCSPHNFCEHDRSLYGSCKDCNRNMCIHDRSLYGSCRDCNRNMCIHDNYKDSCEECGMKLCKHEIRKTRCKECDGSELCKSEWCVTQVIDRKKYKGLCFRCFLYLHPDESVTKNFKTKEREVIKFIKDNFPNHKFTFDKVIKGGCSQRRPDIFIDLGYMVLIIEIDENQHDDYDKECENRRLMEISRDIGHRPLVMIRFNPDSYIDSKENKFQSCWKSGKLVKCRTKEWEKRLETLGEIIKYYLNPDNTSEMTAKVVYLFYDGHK